MSADQTNEDVHQFEQEQKLLIQALNESLNDVKNFQELGHKIQGLENHLALGITKKKDKSAFKFLKKSTRYKVKAAVCATMGVICTTVIVLTGGWRLSL